MYLRAPAGQRARQSRCIDGSGGIDGIVVVAKGNLG